MHVFPKHAIVLFTLRKTKEFSMETYYLTSLHYLLRVMCAALCGACIGFEREKRFKTAGIRTHILVALSSCLMMVISKYGFWDVVGMKGISLDVSRIAAGVVTAIGFLGAGVIFVRKESITGVTTAAGLWATVGVGISIGSGMYFLGVTTTLMILLIQFMLHKPLKIFSAQLFGNVRMDIPQEQFNKELLDQTFADKKIQVKNMQMDRDGDNVIVRLGVVFPQEFNEAAIMNEFKEYPYISSIEYYPSN